MPIKIVPPKDRTQKQAVRAYCVNPQCWEDDSGGRFEFTVEHGEIACPKCGANEPPMVGLLVLVHMLLPDQKGPIRGSGGLRYKLGCEQARAYLATETNLEAATGDIQAANCPGCLKAAEALGIEISGKQLGSGHFN